MAAEKLSIVSHFHGLVPDANSEQLESFVKLGTHCEPRRGELSYICDISILRVKIGYHLAVHLINTVVILI